MNYVRCCQALRTIATRFGSDDVYIGTINYMDDVSTYFYNSNDYISCVCMI